MDTHTTNPALATLLATAPRCAGLHVGDLGEDDDMFVIGHHPDRQVVDALNEYYRTTWGDDVDLTDAEVAGDLVRAWAVVTPGPADDPLTIGIDTTSPDTPGAVAFTFWCIGSFQPRPESIRRDDTA